MNEIKIDVSNNTDSMVQIKRSDDESTVFISVNKAPDTLKNAGDNLILGCEDSRCDGWIPQVGSIVTWGNKSVKGEVKALSDGLAWIKNEYGNYCSEYVSSLQKPKTPEEELRDDIIAIANLKHPAGIAHDLMSKYNITPKEV